MKQSAVYKNWYFAAYQVGSSSLVVLLYSWFLKNFRDLRNLDDPMLLSGYVIVIVGVTLGIIIDRDPVRVVEKLHIATVLPLFKNEWLRIKSTLMSSFLLYQVIFCLLAVVLKLAFVENLWDMSIHPPPNIVIYILIGTRLGRLVANGTIGRTIYKIAGRVELQVGHLDRAGGLASVGNFYLLQGLVVIVPMVWIISWIWMSFLPYFEGYRHWRGYYLLLLVLIWIVFGYGFYRPMITFRNLIIDWKSRERVESLVAHIRADIVAMKAHSWYTDNFSMRIRRRQLRERFQDLYSLTSLPDWPVSSAVLWTFFSGIGLPSGFAILSVVIDATI